MKRTLVLAAAGLLALLGGCASYDGRGLVPGRSTAAEVEASMGRPAEKLVRAGETIWYYPRGPAGWHTYAVRIGPDGVLRAIEQRITVENVRRLALGITTRQEVRELLGPPFLVSRLPRQKREVWEYQMIESGFKWKLWVQFSDDAVVREVLQLPHPDEYSPGDGRQ